MHAVRRRPVPAVEQAGQCPATPQAWQRGSSDALPHTLEVLVSLVESDILQCGELCVEDLLGFLEHDLTTRPTGDAAQDQNVVDVVVLRVLRNRITQVDTNGLVDLSGVRLLAGIFHGRLNHFQALRVRLVRHVVHVCVLGLQVVGQIDAALRSQPRRSPLAEVHVRDAIVGCPGIVGRVRVEIQLDVADLVDPAQEVAVSIAVAASLTAAHGDAKEVALLHHHHAGQGRDFAIVDDLQRHVAKLFSKLCEDGYHLLLVNLGGNVGEDVAPGCLVVAGDGASGTATDSIHPGQVACCLLHRGEDLVPVVLRVRVRDIPLCLLGRNDFVVLHSNRLDVALAEVEGEAATIGVGPADLRRILRERKVLGSGHDENLKRLVRVAADLWHRQHFKPVLAHRGEGLLQLLTEVRWAAEVQPVGAPLPEHALDEDSRKVEGGARVHVALGEDRENAATNTVGTYQCPLQDILAAGSA
mmetsp:Transcript_29895/g.67813  ORF Transcript_29895/g.67813 Transcript_29895/m.67813 type:complete len:471 (-) Transcript_29895:820-2232(-)